MKTKTIGTGITQKQVPELTTPEAVREFREAHNGDVLARIEAQAKETLRKAGLKTVPHLNDPPETQSPAWYAQETMWRFRTLDGYIRRGLSREAACVAFHIGALWREAEIKFRWEDAALRGERQKENLASGRKSLLTDQDILAVINDPAYPTRKKQAKRLGLTERQLYRRREKLKNMS